MPRVVHVVGGCASFQTATEYLLKQEGYAVASYPSGQYFLDHFPNESVRSCILLKVRMPELSGPELQERLSERGSALPIIFFTRYPDVPTVVRTIKAGALDFLVKPIPSDQLLQAVGQGIAHYEAIRTLDAVRSRLATLTPREREVFELIVRGKSHKQIANALGVAARTIKSHRHRVTEKMQVQSLAELVSLAERLGVMSGRAFG